LVRSTTTSETWQGHWDVGGLGCDATKLTVAQRERLVQFSHRIARRARDATQSGAPMDPHPAWLLSHQRILRCKPRLIILEPRYEFHCILSLDQLQLGIVEHLQFADGLGLL
jgi:hypothetical protein